jgi:ankyrin repeat protein
MRPLFKVAIAIAIITGILIAIGISLFYTDPLTRAAKRGDTHEIQRLIDPGYDVDRRSFSFGSDLYTDWTPLMWAAWNGHPESALLLLESGANPNAQSSMSMTLLDCAIMPHRVDPAITLNLCTDLLRFGANPNHRSGIGNTPLHTAVMRRDHDIVRLLILNGADINAYNNNRHTPLDRSIISQPDQDVARVLIAHGATTSLSYGQIANHLKGESPSFPEDLLTALEEIANQN